MDNYEEHLAVTKCFRAVCKMQKKISPQCEVNHFTH